MLRLFLPTPKLLLPLQKLLSSTILFRTVANVAAQAAVDSAQTDVSNDQTAFDNAQTADIDPQTIVDNVQTDKVNVQTAVTDAQTGPNGS